MYDFDNSSYFVIKDHMREMFKPNRHPEMFTEAFKHPEKPVDWDTIFEGFDAAVDWY